MSVASAYDSTVREFANNARMETRPMRTFNNKVKSALISECVRYHRPSAVLDLCCGRGGDMGKILREPCVRFYQGIDISPESIREAVSRSATHNRHGATILTEVQDVSRGFTTNRVFNLINQQFSLHYMWAPDTVDDFLASLSSQLSPGGLWIGTVPNKGMIDAAISGELVLPPICRITPVNPHTYSFYLQGCVAGVHEHYVRFNAEHLAQYNLVLRLHTPMLEYAAQRGIFLRPENQRLIAGLYDVFIMQKIE